MKVLTKGRLSVALAIVALCATVALPAFAFAAGTFSGEYPAPAAALVVTPSVVAVDLAVAPAAALNAKSAVITIDGTAYPTFVKQAGNTAGTWAKTETLQANGSYKVVWTWTGGTNAVASIYCYPPKAAMADGSKAVVVNVLDVNKVAYTTNWTFSLTAPIVTPPVVPPVAVGTYTGCDNCHATKHNGGDFGSNCAGCHSDGFPSHYIGDGQGTGHGAIEAAFATNSAGCVSCHGSDISAVLPANWDGAGAVSEHKGCSCHNYGYPHAGTTYDACEDCHSNWTNPAGSHPFHVTAHDAIDKTDSAVCISCHGSNYYAVGSRTSAYGDVHVPAVPGEAVQEHKGCSCHAYGEAEAPKECVDCHAPHGFSQTVAPWDPNGTWVPMGGHNTPLYDVNGGAEQFGASHIVVKDSMGNTIEQEWPRPTAGVFWSQSNAVKVLKGETVTATVVATDAPLVAMDSRGFASAAEGAAAINTTVGWDSVITCYDCHTELEGLQGPQGANAANFGLDPNFPDDWTKAELTSWDPTGMRSIATTSGGTNPYYATIGAGIYTPDDMSVPSWITTEVINGDPSSIASVAIGGFYKIGQPASQGYSMGNTDPKRFICQKCHKLTNSFQGQAIEGNGRGNRSNAMNYMGFSNYPHMEHHADMITGQGNCVSCHVAIPHGWKRPRLLVSERDPAPYKVQYVYPGYRTAGTGVGAAKDPNPDLSNGNWGYLGVGSSNTLYASLTASNPLDATKLNSSHLEKVSASPNAHKELEAIPQEEFEHYEGGYEVGATKGEDVMVARGYGNLMWDTWDYTTNGVNWHADTSNARGHYNNCSACTSANNRHDDTVAGVAPDVPYWK